MITALSLEMAAYFEMLKVFNKFNKLLIVYDTIIL